MKKIPDQVKRLVVPFAGLIVLLLAAQHFLTPASFRKYGHYRGDAVNEIAALDIHYAGKEACRDCHSDVVEKKNSGYHKGLSCEVCHGPAKNHTEDQSANKPPAPRDRKYCVLCHEYLPSRPTGFPQIISATHNPGKACFTCHNPHDPKPPHVPEECSACHANIARTKAVSSHAVLPCTRCHEADKKHFVSPRENLPKKPMERAFCGGCHARDAKSDPGIPRIDLADHNPGYLCWQCHYPHLPEAR